AVPANEKFRDFSCPAAQLSRDLLEQLESALAIVSKSEAVTQEQLAGVQFAEDSVVQEISRADSCQLGTEMQHDRLFYSEPLHSFHFLLKGLKQGRSRVGVQDGSRMGIEGYHG